MCILDSSVSSTPIEEKTPESASNNNMGFLLKVKPGTADVTEPKGEPINIEPIKESPEDGEITEAPIKEELSRENVMKTENEEKNMKNEVTAEIETKVEGVEAAT